MSQSAVQRLTQTRELTSAILLTAGSVFAPSAGSPYPAAGPFTRVAGLTLFQRSLLTLQRCGIGQVFVLAGDEADRLKAVLSEGPPVTLGVRWIPVREFPPEDPRTWEALAADATGACLVVGPHAAFSRGLIEMLRGMGQVDDVVVVLRRTPGGSTKHGVQDPAGGCASDELTHLADTVRAAEPSAEPGTRVASELMVVPAGGFVKGSPLAELLLARSGDDHAGGIPMRRLVEAAAAEGRVSVVEVKPDSTAWVHEVRHDGDARVVERALYRSLKDNFEGIVDRYFNRKLSPSFTKLFLALSFSPNAITVLATLIGLAGAVCIARGSYAAGLLGAVLFQLSAVIDCCDGEVARLTFSESPLGAKLDMWLDNVVHAAIFGGLTYGAYHQPPPGLDPHLFVWAGTATILANLVSFGGVTLLTSRQAQGPRSSWADFLLKHVATRDFSLVILIFAALGHLPWFLLLAAAGSILFGLMTLGLLLFVRPPSS